MGWRNENTIPIYPRLAPPFLGDPPKPVPRHCSVSDGGIK